VSVLRIPGPEVTATACRHPVLWNRPIAEYTAIASCWFITTPTGEPTSASYSGDTAPPGTPNTSSTPAEASQRTT
jgi:hypothetical protein